MARPAIAVDRNTLEQALVQAGSMRGAAQLLNVSRWTVQQRVRAFGLPLPTKDESSTRVRYLRSIHRSTATSTTVATEMVWGDPGSEFGCTVARRLVRHRYLPCVWPNCSEPRFIDALCRLHQQPIRSMSCCWPGCPQDAPGSDDLYGGLCYAHRKLADGTIGEWT